jgi:hypothetical protein
VASERGRAQTHPVSRLWPLQDGGCKAQRGFHRDPKESEIRFLVEGYWKGPPQRVIVSYAKGIGLLLMTLSTTEHANSVGSREAHFPRLNTLDDR